MALALSLSDRTVTAPAILPIRHFTRSAAAPRKKPRLSIVIVNYCLWEETAALVRQVLNLSCMQEGDAEVVVVDNHSPPHALSNRLRRWPSVSLRRWGANRGFARAVNEGFRLSRGEWVLLLNPDISVTEDFLSGVQELAADLSKDPSAGIAGFQLRNSDGSRQLSSGPFPTLASTLLRMLLPRHRRKYDFLQTTRRRKVPWVTGCCLLLRRQCFEELGGLDRNFFLYYEDVDLCRRARDQGWTVWYEPTLKATHHRPLHIREVPPYLRLLTRHALMTYAHKHWPEWQFQALTWIVTCEARVRERIAQFRGDSTARQVFQRLGCIAGNMMRGRRDKAHRCLAEVVRQEGRQRAS